jgi:hypothetical protein
MKVRVKGTKRTIPRQTAKVKPYYRNIPAHYKKNK